GTSPTAPFTVNVLPDNWDSPCDQWFALDKAPGTVPPPPPGRRPKGGPEPWTPSRRGTCACN
ncbi:transcriptional regulator, partial [Streptomyces sp. NPDC059233]